MSVSGRYDSPSGPAPAAELDEQIEIALTRAGSRELPALSRRPSAPARRTFTMRVPMSPDSARRVIGGAL